MEGPGSEFGGSKIGVVVDAETGLSLKLDRRGPPPPPWLDELPCATSERADDEDDNLDLVLGFGTKISPSVSPESLMLLVDTVSGEDGRRGSE